MSDNEILCATNPTLQNNCEHPKSTKCAHPTKVVSNIGGTPQNGQISMGKKGGFDPPQNVHIWEPPGFAV